MNPQPEFYEIYGLVTDSWWRSPQALIWYAALLVMTICILFFWYSRRRRIGLIVRSYEEDAIARLETWKQQCEHSFADVSLVPMYEAMMGDFKRYLEVRYCLQGTSMTDQELLHSLTQMIREKDILKLFMLRASSVRFAGRSVSQKEAIEDIVLISGLMKELISFQASSGKQLS